MPRRLPCHQPALHAPCLAKDVMTPGDGGGVNLSVHCLYHLRLLGRSVLGRETFALSLASPRFTGVDVTSDPSAVCGQSIIHFDLI